MAAKGARKGNNSAQSSGRERKPPKGTPFEPGKSGNPGGLPKWRRELAEAMKESAQAGANLLDSVIRDPGVDMQHRIQAASVALKLTVPAPKQQVEVSGSMGALATLDAATLLKLARGE
jgi:hypothetical protein